MVEKNQDFNIPCGTAVTEFERDCHALTTTAMSASVGAHHPNIWVFLDVLKKDQTTIKRYYYGINIVANYV